MSATYHCTDCRFPIPAGEAVIRSQSFQRVTYCRPCAIDLGIFVPAPVESVEVMPQRVA